MTSSIDGVCEYRWITIGYALEKYVELSSHKSWQRRWRPWSNILRMTWNLSELDTLHESYCDSVYPEEGWTFDDVLQLLRKLPFVAVDEYQRTGPDLKRSDWYNRLFGYLNDDCPRTDGVWINFDCPIGDFCSKLIEFEAGAYQSIERLNDAKAIWFGRLALLSHLPWTDSTPVEQRRAFSTLVDQFNDANCL